MAICRTLRLAGFWALFSPALSAGLPQAPWVSCWDKSNEGPAHSVRQRTPTVTSPNGKFRAYAEIRAVAEGLGSCANTAELFVSSMGGAFHSVFVQKPSERSGTADSLGPVAWSFDSRYLVIERLVLFYGSDYGGRDVLLYDARAGHISNPDIATAIEHALRPGCVLGLRSVKGFDDRGRIVVSVSDWKDDEPSEITCVPTEADWLSNPATRKATPRR